jgi:hypothetical protein
MRKRLTFTRFALAVGFMALAAVGLVHAATALRATAVFDVSGQFVNDLDLGVDPSYNFRSQKTISYENGVGAGQVDKVFADQRTLTASSTEDLDIVGGGLTDAFGATFTLVELKVLMVCAASTNTNNVVLGGDANSVPFLSAATTTVSIKPGGCFQLADPSAAGIAVTAGTGDILQVANSGGGTSVVYDIIVLGSGS